MSPFYWKPIYIYIYISISLGIISSCLLGVHKALEGPKPNQEYSKKTKQPF